jgi:hypothetical protein
VENNHLQFVRIMAATNQGLQIVALIVAGLWALWTWNQATAPALKTGLNLSGEVDSSWDASSNACQGDVTVTIENLGQRNIVVSRVEYHLLKAEPPRLASNEAVKVVGTLPKSTELVEKGDLDPRFLGGGYAPKVRHSQTLITIFRPDIKEQLWFKFEAFDPSGTSLDFWYGSIPACHLQ